MITNTTWVKEEAHEVTRTNKHVVVCFNNDELDVQDRTIGTS